MKRDISTIIFDIGNVLVDFRWKEFIAGYGYDEVINDRVAKASVLNPDWNEYDLGNLSDEEIIDLFVKNDPGVEEQIRRIYAEFDGLLVQYDYAKPWIRELKDMGYSVYYLSNFSHKAETECAKEIDFIHLTDGGIISYRVNMTKPDHRIYKLLADRYDLDPAKCLFFDDTPANVTAAKECGYNAEVFKSYEEARRHIKA